MYSKAGNTDRLIVDQVSENFTASSYRTNNPTNPKNHNRIDNFVPKKGESR